MLPVPEVLRSWRTYWQPDVTAVEEVALTEALGRVLAQAVTAADDVPPFSRSTVDGFAVRAADTFGASEGLPAFLNILEDIRMGQVPPQKS